MRLACVVLAAGEGRRLGLRNKALLPWRGHSFLGRIAELCSPGCAGRVVVVVGPPHGDATTEAAKSLGLASVYNPEPGRGMASSVALGFAYAKEAFESDACWLWPVDVPGVLPSTLARLALHARPDAIVTPRFEGRGGHPSLIGRDVWSELEVCDGEPEGARSVLRRSPNRRVYIDVEDSAVRHDVDCPEHLETLPC